MSAGLKMDPDHAATPIPPLLHAVPPRKQSAPTLYAIIFFKFVKALVLILFAFAVFSMRHSNIQQELSRALTDPALGLEGPGFAAAAEVLQNISAQTIQLFAVGSFLYAVFSLIEGTGLIFRAAWAGWLVIAESAVFIPLELWETLQHFTAVAVLILVLNIAIVWYLYANRVRLFTRQPFPA